MASPREIAEKAFALLQNALSESEARATDLDEQLRNVDRIFDRVFRPVVATA